MKILLFKVNIYIAHETVIILVIKIEINELYLLSTVVH